jgi:mRNA (2'-O-methyladenosine-N6-)-methyltransferase
MKSLPIPQLQDAGGLLFLWVTGRAMEVGRDCLTAWGYKRIDEIVWIKTSQLQKLVRTGRTGHWINHAKVRRGRARLRQFTEAQEHCLVAYKLPAIPEDPVRTLAWTATKGLDTNVLVAQVRETSRKPDEIYSMIERLAPSARRLEVFGRMHNTRPGWLTVGNQLEGRGMVFDPVLRARWEAANPSQRL